MKNFLKSKIVVITGASSGIGEAMAKLYAQMGAKVVLGARSGEKLKALSEQIVFEGGQAAWCQTDVTKAEDCKRLIDTAVENFGGIDILICNAGISMRAIFDDVDYYNTDSKEVNYVDISKEWARDGWKNIEERNGLNFIDLFYKVLMPIFFTFNKICTSESNKSGNGRKTGRL